MPKATLEFALPEEQEEFDSIEENKRLSLAVYDFYMKIRNLRKYQEDRWEKLTSEEVYEMFTNALDENDASFF